MKFLYCVIALIFIFSGCVNQSYTGYKSTSEEIEREKLADEIIAKVAAKLEKNRGLIPCGFGGRISNGVQILALSFDYRKPINTEIGRKLLVFSVQEFISQVNAEKRIRPYLKNYPFSPENIEIRIFLQNSNGSKIMSGLRVITACGGILEYNVADPDGPSFKTLLEETYEEALEKLNAQQEIDMDDPTIATLEKFIRAQIRARCADLDFLQIA